MVVDQLKEQIAYLRLWLGVFLVTDMSLVGWLSTKATGSPQPLFVAGLLLVAGLTIALLFLHRAISERIKRLKTE